MARALKINAAGNPRQSGINAYNRDIRCESGAMAMAGRDFRSLEWPFSESFPALFFLKVLVTICTTGRMRREKRTPMSRGRRRLVCGRLWPLLTLVFRLLSFPVASYWGEAGGGLQQWDAQFPGAEVTLALNSVSGSSDPTFMNTTARFLYPSQFALLRLSPQSSPRRPASSSAADAACPPNPPPFPHNQMTAQATSAVTPLDDSDPTLATYSDALWFEGDFPALGTDWPSADPYVVITPISPAGTEFTPLRVQLFECREMQQPGRACPYPPPPAPVGGAAGPAQAPGGTPGPLEAPTGGNSTGTSRRLMQFSSDWSEDGCAHSRSPPFLPLLM